ncbi:MAG TPA: hypothetical protein VFQ05_18855 [Candidatus Eisenbacteria bacterium]|nr:hypothetical protein [Candidatus Eisenbacteria bacterium]
MIRTIRWLPWMGFALAVLEPALAFACPVCGGGDSPRTQAAFFNTTVLLSLLPLGLIGGGMWWLKREAQDSLAGEFEERDALPPKPAERGRE